MDQLQLDGMPAAEEEALEPAPVLRAEIRLVVASNGGGVLTYSVGRDSGDQTSGREFIDPETSPLQWRCRLEAILLERLCDQIEPF